MIITVSSSFIGKFFKLSNFNTMVISSKTAYSYSLFIRISKRLFPVVKKLFDNLYFRVNTTTKNIPMNLLNNKRANILKSYTTKSISVSQTTKISFHFRIPRLRYRNFDLIFHHKLITPNLFYIPYIHQVTFMNSKQ